jgi:hypothetical protein
MRASMRPPTRWCERGGAGQRRELFGADFTTTAHSDNNIAPGAPRTIKAQLRFGF